MPPTKPLMPRVDLPYRTAMERARRYGPRRARSAIYLPYQRRERRYIELTRAELRAALGDEYDDFMDAMGMPERPTLEELMARTAVTTAAVLEQAEGTPLEAIARSLVGCSWGSVISHPEDRERCSAGAVRIVVLHTPEGGELEGRFCARHLAFLEANTDPHQEAADAGA